MNRRDLLKGITAIVPMTVAGRVWAAPNTDLRFLVVFLRGAYDAANVVIPVSSDFYYESRPTLAVPRPGSGAADAALPLTADWGLHPALKESIWPLWQKKQIAFIPFAGTDDLTRSLSLGDEVAPRIICLTWHRDRYRTPAARAFASAARAVCVDLDLDAQSRAAA